MSRLEPLGHLFSLADRLLPRRTGRDGLLEENGDVGEVGGELEFEVSRGGETASEGWWSRDEDGPEISGGL